MTETAIRPTAPSPCPADPDREPPPRQQRPPAGRRLGWLVAASLAAGLIAALVLVALPVVPAEESALTGAVLLGFALGWALLAGLSLRFTDQPQRWAAAPAAFFAAVGLASLSGSATVLGVLGWVWPPALLVLVVWMLARLRRQLPSRVARWMLYPVLAVLGIASLGGGYQTVRESLDARAYPMPGQLVDVGGYGLHLHCTGSGTPTVILEPGHGGSSSDFGLIAPAVARDSTVCVYDRPGRGWSDATAVPQDGDRIARDLHTLLDRAQVPGPYVLAGHSFGGLYVLRFAALFPDQVAGLVLLDSTSPKPAPAVPTGSGPDSGVRRAFALLSTLAHLGVGRLVAQTSYDTLPPQDQRAARANASTARYLASYWEEFLQANTAMQQASSLTSLDGKPLIVVSADLGQNDAQWPAKQSRLAGLSTNSQHRHAEATHGSLIHDPADAVAASRAVRDVVEVVRTGQPLS